MLVMLPGNEEGNHLYYNNNILYSSQWEIKAVVRSNNEHITYVNNSKSWTTRTYTLLDIRLLSLNLHTLILSNSKFSIIKYISDNNIFDTYLLFFLKRL